MNENKILQTQDYEMFKKIKGNRDIDYSNVAKIKKSIEEKGWVRNPILVNEKMEVIDGQHRLLALKHLKMPVEYIVLDGATLQEVQTLNSNKAGWKKKDYINAGIEKGNEAMIELVKIVKMYPNFEDAERVVVMLLNNKKDVCKCQDWLNIKLSNDTTETIYICDLINEVYSAFPKKSDYSKTKIGLSLVKVSKLKEVNMERVVTQVKKKIELFENINNDAKIIQIIENLYNARLSEDKKVSICFLLKSRKDK